MNNMVRVLLPLFFNVLILLFSMANAETTEVRDALVQFMENLSPADDLKDENWGWNMTSDPCQGNWTGVTCNDNSPTIKKIVLEELNLTGLLDARSLCMAETLTVLSLHNNNVEGPLPEEISNCSRLTHIYLHGNNFSGNLPGSFSRLGNLKRVVISDNGFSGDIPDMSSISGLITFLAQNNSLVGGIPKFDFSNLEEFNVSYNNLTGSLPDFLGHFNETSFLGNPGLCGGPLPNACPPAPPPPPLDKRKGSSNKDYFIYSGYVAIGLVIIASLVVFLVIKNRKRKEMKKVTKTSFHADKITSSTTSSEVKGAGENRSEFSLTSAENGRDSTSLVVLSSSVANELKFEDLLRSPAELMGRGRHGSLYKVTVNERLVLAVKRIRDWDITKDEFKKRMERIDQVKHPNVMPVIAFYCSRQEKLLVYEFQPNGSLFSLLHESQNGQSFDWGSRLNLATKTSEALAFMHEGLGPDSIAHGNLKSSNILLNNQMEPLISEYGLLEVSEQQGQAFPDQINDHSPEAVTMSPNNDFKADIFKFGAILLELLTGKPVKNNAFDLARWVNSAIREEWTVEVFDKALVSEGASEESMVSLLQVALKCISSSPEARPSMREVAGMINTIKEYEEKSIDSETSDP